MVVVGNIICFIGSIFMIIAGNIKSKGKSLIFQTAQMFSLSIGNLVLGSPSGFILNLISVVRNILGYKNWLNKIAIGIIIAISIALTVMFNTLGLVGYLPLLANIIFILFMNTKSDINFKIITIIYLILWNIHDLFIQGYVMMIFNAITIVSCIIAIIRIKKDKELVKN